MMEQSLVIKLSNVAVFFIKDKNISYYLSVPIVGNEKVNIAINVNSNINNESIVSFSKRYDSLKFCVISPVFNENILLQAKSVNEQVFLYLDKCVSYLINNVYKTLSSNNREVDSKIILIGNDNYSAFDLWFVSRYKQRVEYIKDISSNGLQSSSMVMQSSVVSNSANLSSAVEEDAEGKKANSVLDSMQEVVTSSDSSNVVIEEKDLGFVSYVLLGVVVAVVVLIGLYLLI